MNENFPLINNVKITKKLQTNKQTKTKTYHKTLQTILKSTNET